MAQLRQSYQEYIKLNTRIITIGPEEPGPFADWWREHGMPFTGIADPQHQLANLYGQQVKILKMGRLPAQFIIDRAGLIRYRHFGNSMSDIPPDDELLDILKKLNAEKDRG